MLVHGLGEEVAGQSGVDARVLVRARGLEGVERGRAGLGRRVGHGGQVEAARPRQQRQGLRGALAAGAERAEELVVVGRAGIGLDNVDVAAERARSRLKP